MYGIPPPNASSGGPREKFSARRFRLRRQTAREKGSALETAEIVEQRVAKLDVLLTDVIMPGLRGPDLARRVSERHPGVHVLYMSGYAEGLPETQLPPNSTFLQKPFRFATLLERLKLVQRKA